MDANTESVAPYHRGFSRPVFLVLLTLLVGSFNGDQSHARIVGRWVHTFSPTDKLYKASEFDFHSDGTLTRYAQVDLRNGFPSPRLWPFKVNGGYFVACNGTYVFKDNVLICQFTTVGKPSQEKPWPHLIGSGQYFSDAYYTAFLNGDTLTLRQQWLSCPSGPLITYQKR